jgi:gliding motility-associated-like protein
MGEKNPPVDFEISWQEVENFLNNLRTYIYPQIEDSSWQEMINRINTAFTQLAGHWSEEANYVSLRYDWLTLVRIIKEYVPYYLKDKPFPTGTQWMWDVSEWDPHEGADVGVPEVEILTPGEGETVEGIVEIRAEITDDWDVREAEWVIEGEGEWAELEEEGGNIYRINWDTSLFSHGRKKVIVRGYDQTGKWGEDEVEVIVRFLDDPPVVEIISPREGETVSGLVKVKAEASDDYGVEKVEFYFEGDLKFTDQDTPYSWDWETEGLVKGASYTLKAVAYDTIGQTSFSKVKVVISLEDEPPEVVFLNPGDGEKISGKVPVIVEVKDDYGIVSVEFYLEEDLIYSAVSKYNWTWETEKVKNGAYQLKVVACDTKGQTDEDFCQVIVRNIPLLDEYVLSPNQDNTNDLVEFGQSSIIRIYDAKGKLVRQLDENTPEWEGKDSSGNLCPNGVYIFQITEEGEVIKTGKILLVK